MGELIVAILFFVGVSYVIGLVRNASVAGARAVKKAVTGKETYFGPPQLKLFDEVHESTGWNLKLIKFRGMMPVDRGEKNLSYSISAFDTTDGEENYRPVISLVEAAQEETTVCFGLRGDLGSVSEGSSLTDWFQVGAIAPELCQTPFSGDRKIDVVLRIFESDSEINIVHGAGVGDEALVFEVASFRHQFEDKGYEEEVEHREEAQAISLKVAMAVAMADGTLDDAEGEVIKHWIEREVAAYSGEKAAALKDLFNNTLKEAYKEAASGDLLLSDLVDRLSVLDMKKSNYDAVELCLDVMAADGVAEPEEMAVIRNVARGLDLDMEEIEKMREKVTLNLSSQLGTQEGLEALVGIEESWSNEDKKKHLRKEFQKWSNRLGSLPEGDEKDSAQAMLDNIAILRKKYG